MDKNHFAVKVEGKQKVDVYFAQTAPMTSCVAKITIRDGEEVRHIVVAHGEAIHNPKDAWDAMIGKRKAFGKMKDNLSFPVIETCGTFSFRGMIYHAAVQTKYYGKPLPTEREFERAFYEWMKEN